MKVSELEKQVNTELLTELEEKAKKILKEKIKTVKLARKTLAALEKDLEAFKNSDIENIEDDEFDY